MTETQNTPIWLDMRTEYIDANFEKFVNYIYSNRKNTDESFYRISLELLHKRVEELMAEISEMTLRELDTVDFLATQEQSIFGVRLMALSLLAEPAAPECAEYRRVAMLYMLLLLSRLCSLEQVDGLMTAAMQLLTGSEVENLGFSWDDVMQFYPDVMVKKITGYLKSGSNDGEARWYAGNGMAMVKGGTLSLMNIQSQNKASSLQRVMGLFGERLKVMSNSGVKVGAKADMQAIDSFAKDYVAGLKPAELQTEKKLLRYSVDHKEAVDLRIVELGYDYVRVETIDPSYQKLRGTISKLNILCMNLQDAVKSWTVGQEVQARIAKMMPGGEAQFDVTKDLLEYMLDYCVLWEPVRGVAQKVDNGNTMWLTEKGYPLYTQKMQYEAGTCAELEMTDKGQSGYLKAVIADESVPVMDEVLAGEITRLAEASKINNLKSFCYEPSEVAEDSENEGPKMIGSLEMKALKQLLFVQQKLVSDSMERYRTLCVLRICCKMLGDDEGVEFATFLTQYLNNLVHFAKGDVLSMAAPDMNDRLECIPSVRRRMSVLAVLHCYEKQCCDEELARYEGDEEQTVSQLARLVQAGNRLQDVLSKAMQNAIRYEILKMLRLGDNTATNLEDDSGIYLGIENGSQEFKTSVVYPPENKMKPLQSEQEVNVFKAVCAFLNSQTGGVVYLGVNDLGMVVGVQNDLDYLKVNLDGYMRHVTDRLIKTFGQDVVTLIDIKLMYDEQVVAVKVKPCGYKIVELHGKAYIRMNAENREMSPSLRLQVLDGKRTFNKDVAENLSALQLAIGRKCQVVLHGYSSSNSGDKRDRTLEPFAFSSHQKHVWCYDLEAEKVKLFSLSRIKNVEVLDSQWTASQYHKAGKMDIFNMTSNHYTKAVLELDRMAYNLILEEFPDSKHCLTDGGNDTWILDVEVCSVYGIGRFYLGLADHIRILDAPELEAYAKEYFDRNKR